MKNHLPTTFILSVKPVEYLTQGISHCGAYSVKAILSAFGKDDKKRPEEYHPNFFNRFTGLTLGKNYYSKILNKYGIITEFKSAKNLPDVEKIGLLKTLLSENVPIMIRIGNGYFRSKKYNPFLGKIINHWITLWGYNDKKMVFYIYDSGLTKNLYDDVPIGNTKRTYDEILRDWNFGTWQFWTWHISLQNYVYIKINKKFSA